MANWIRRPCTNCNGKGYTVQTGVRLIRNLACRVCNGKGHFFLLEEDEVADARRMVGKAK